MDEPDQIDDTPPDNELANKLIEKSQRRWLWIYGYSARKDEIPQDRLDEVHMFDVGVIPKKLAGVPTFPLEGSPSCGDNLLERRPFWFLFNTGAGDARRLAAIAGNDTIICKACEALEAP